MEIIRAGLSDIDVLIDLRVDFLKNDGETLSVDDETTIRKQLKTYFEKHLLQGDFIAYITKEDKTIMATAFVVINERSANPSFITGITGTLLNVFIYPEYQRRGIASKLMNKLIDEARTLSVTSLDLYSTAQGKRLYTKCGFKETSCTAMQLTL